MKAAALISFAGSQLAETRHVFAFFNSEEEEYRGTRSGGPCPQP